MDGMRGQRSGKVGGRCVALGEEGGVGTLGEGRVEYGYGSLEVAKETFQPLDRSRLIW